MKTPSIQFGTEIPEHLLKRSRERRERLGLNDQSDTTTTPEAATDDSGESPSIKAEYKPDLMQLNFEPVKVDSIDIKAIKKRNKAKSKELKGRNALQSQEAETEVAKQLRERLETIKKYLANDFCNMDFGDGVKGSEFLAVAIHVFDKEENLFGKFRQFMRPFRFRWPNYVPVKKFQSAGFSKEQKAGVQSAIDKLAQRSILSYKSYDIPIGLLSPHYKLYVPLDILKEALAEYLVTQQ